MPARLGLHFVSPAALEAGLAGRWQSERRLVPVKDTSGLSRASLPENDARPAIEVDARVSDRGGKPLAQGSSGSLRWWPSAADCG